jgi:hypothetical protein
LLTKPPAKPTTSASPTPTAPFRPHGKPKMREWKFFQPVVEVEEHLELFQEARNFV